MPRTSRAVIPGCVYHVTQRGNNRQDMFFVDAWILAMDEAIWCCGLEQSDDEVVVTRLRLSTSRGRPLGSDAFIAKLETALPPGRPRRSPKTRVEPIEKGLP